MSSSLSRRSLLKTSGFAFGASLLPLAALAAPAGHGPQQLIHLNLNENAFGPSSSVLIAIQQQLSRLSRYADSTAAQSFAEQIAAYERIPVEQVVLGEILGALGLYLGSQGGPGGEFIYSKPGYLALIDAASRVGGIGVPVPLDAQYSNDLPALSRRSTAKPAPSTSSTHTTRPGQLTTTRASNISFTKRPSMHPSS